MKQAGDDYHKRAQQEDYDNAVYVLGYNPDTGDFKPAAATLGVGLVNKVRGGLFMVGVGITTAGKFTVSQVHAFTYELASWNGYKDAAADCEVKTRLP